MYQSVPAFDDLAPGVGVVPRPDSQQERQVAQAAEKNRNFMNRPGNPWFKPKGNRLGGLVLSVGKVGRFFWKSGFEMPISL